MGTMSGTGRLIPVHGNLVHIRPVRQPDLPLLNDWENDPEASGLHAPFSFHTFSSHEKDLAEHGMLRGDGGLLLVETMQDPHAVGVVGFFNFSSLDRGPEFGCQIAPTDRGRGYGTEAQQLLVDYLFGHLGAHRVQAQTAATNLAEQAALHNVGLGHEGTRRQASYANGIWLDVMVFGMLRTEWTARRR